jgi:hypothetical protein
MGWKQCDVKSMWENVEIFIRKLDLRIYTLNIL